MILAMPLVNPLSAMQDYDRPPGHINEQMVLGGGSLKSHLVCINKKYPVRFFVILAGIVFAVFVVCHVRDRQAIAALSTSMWRIEPETPVDIGDPPFPELPYPSKILPVAEVMTTGKQIPLRYAYDQPDWKRRAYRPYWHSSYGRWSYVPNLIHTAMHRIFVTYPTASVFYDFIHDLGIADESDSFSRPPSDGNPFENIVLVVMQTKVEKIFTLGNQVAVVGRPALSGLQVLLVPVRDLSPYDADESILFQLVTTDGDEFDDAALQYVTAPPSPVSSGR